MSIMVEQGEFYVRIALERCCVTHLCVRRLPVLLQVNRVTNNTSGYLRLTVLLIILQVNLVTNNTSGYLRLTMLLIILQVT